ncbi:MAG: MBOAT family protein [Lachnospiraceae bacterium]|jgi:D-alanyl-lipoteichoic acid acyltransferase DltB (MBOAT superfamily)|nr:MBOAT family protein [Lachnospiraceae bacterium]
MLFNSLGFAIFLPIVFLLFWAMPQKHRWIVLLLSSYYFYMSWNVKYVVLILFTTIVSYVTALILEKTPREGKRKLCLTLALCACLGVLFVFKYFNFFTETVVRLLQRFALPIHPVTLKLMLPVGISFYTFQTLSYVIDVYRGEVKAERHFGRYAAFISFFPQLVAGPIERTDNLLPQINKKEFQFSYENASYGLKLMAWGFFKKLVIADNLGVYVDQIFNDVTYYKGFSVLLSVLFFTLQIYCDFSGYSDIAIGTARLFDIRLMTNFKSPYFSGSVREFWTRWHISLSSWFRDYVYIPLGGNRVSRLRNCVNLMVTFLISGLWHGAAWTFVVWGGVHGALQIVEKQLFGKKKLPKLLVFVPVALAWVFFRANSMTDAIYVFSHLFTGITAPKEYFLAPMSDFDWTIKQICFLTAPVMLLAAYDHAALTGDPIETISRLPRAGRWAIYYVFLLTVILLASFNAQEFVYFQF